MLLSTGLIWPTLSIYYVLLYTVIHCRHPFSLIFFQYFFSVSLSSLFRRMSQVLYLIRDNIYNSLHILHIYAFRQVIRLLHAFRFACHRA